VCPKVCDDTWYIKFWLGLCDVAYHWREEYDDVVGGRDDRNGMRGYPIQRVV